MSEPDDEQHLLEDRVIEFIPDAVVVVDPTGVVVHANRHAEEPFGGERGALRGTVLDDQVSTELGSRHASHRASFGSCPHRRPMGAGLELLAQTQEGERLPVEISLSPYELNGE